MSISTLQVTSGLDPELGGPPVALSSSAKALRRAGIQNEVVFAGNHSEGASRECEMLRAEGIPVVRFGLNPVLGSRSYRWGISVALLRWLITNAGRFDVVHTHGAWTFSSASALIAARIRRRPCILTPHESLTEFDIAKKRFPKRLVKRLLRHVYLNEFDAVITASDLERRSTAANREKVRVVPHAVAPLPCEPGPAQISPGLRVGFLGRLDPKKQLEVLLAAMPSLPAEVTLTIAGDGPPKYRQNLECLVAARGLASRVTWLGFIPKDQKGAFFQSIDVLAIPSQYECFCIAAVEALWSGTPVIVSKHVGVAPMVAKYRCGIVVEPTVALIVEGLSKLHEDRDHLQLLASRTRTAAAREFSLAIHGTRLVAEYERTLRAISTRPRLPSEVA